MDSDRAETREWLESLESVMNEEGTDRAVFLLDELEDRLRSKGVHASVHALFCLSQHHFAGKAGGLSR